MARNQGLPHDWPLHWLDTGCEYSPRCLECPLPLCKYDLPPRRARAATLAGEIVALREQGVKVKDIAERMGRTRRSIYRVTADHDRRLRPAREGVTPATSATVTEVAPDDTGDFIDRLLDNPDVRRKLLLRLLQREGVRA